jgi:hypothetical protein
VRRRPELEKRDFTGYLSLLGSQRVLESDPSKLACVRSVVQREEKLRPVDGGERPSDIGVGEAK